MKLPCVSHVHSQEAEDANRGNLTIAVSNYGLELHRVDEIGHVHHQTGIREVSIAVEETGYASIEETTNASLAVQSK